MKELFFEIFTTKTFGKIRGRILTLKNIFLTKIFFILFAPPEEKNFSIEFPKSNFSFENFKNFNNFFFFG